LCSAFCILLAGLHTASATVLEEIPFAMHDGLIWVQVHAAGERQPLDFVLDSGADTSVIHLQTARDLGLRMRRAEKVRGVGSLAAAYPVEDFRAKMGLNPVSRSMLAVDLSEVSKACDRRIDGLIGVDFFNRRVVEIDYVARRLRLLESARERPGDIVLPLEMRRRAFCVPVSVSDGPARWMRLDTGCNEGLILSVRPTRPGRSRESAAIGLVRTRRQVDSTTVRLGSETIPAVRVVLHEGGIFRGESGLLGNGILCRYNVVVDAVGQRLILRKLRVATQISTHAPRAIYR
jgi:hypothetical protein